jgi:branched-chain amino acid transport system permease protein
LRVAALKIPPIIKFILALLLIVGAAYGLQRVLGAEIKNPAQHITNAIWLGSMYSLFALGYALVFSILGVLNLSHSAIFMWGAFIGLVAVERWDFPIWAALPVGMIGGGAVGVLVDQIAFAPLRRREAPRIAQLISSIGMAAVLVNLAKLEFGTQIRSFPAQAVERLPVEIGEYQVVKLPALEAEIRITVMQVAILVVSLILVVLLQFLISATRTGKAMRVVAFNQRTASLLGINVNWVFLLTFFLAGALAGAAGVLYALNYNNLTPFVGEPLALVGLTVIVVGGLGNIRGAVVGGFVVAAVQTYVIALGYSWLRDSSVFLSLFLILLIRPQGLLGEAAIKRA